jgi:shikimate dehydrogenase
VRVLAWVDLGPVTADIVVSTVPSEAQGDDVVAATREVPVVFDVLYDPWPTPLARVATTDGRTVIGGLDLLLWQAVDQVRAMTGRFDVPVEAMREAGEAGLAERRRGEGSVP